jgi:hypothetical protein
MAKPKQAVADPAFLSAALEGLELQRQRIEEQIRYVKTLLGRKRPGGVPSQAGVAAKPAAKRDLSPAARKRISAAQKKRWAKFRKEKASAAASAS